MSGNTIITILILAVIAVVAFITIRNYRKQLKEGCCGAGGTTAPARKWNRRTPIRTTTSTSPT